MSTSGLLRDRLWVRHSFLLSKEALTDADIAQRALTRASLKFTDTTMGGSFAINAPPQFCRFADVNASTNNTIAWSPARGGFIGLDPSIGDDKSAMSHSRGLGRYYSETIDDNGQVLTMRFGVPMYNSFLGFFGNFYDPTASMLARTGRGPGIVFSSMRAVGMALSLPWQPFVLLGRMYKRLRNIPASKFYYMKPTMPLYWNAVSTIVNGIGLNMGITPGNLTPGQKNVMDTERNNFSNGELRRYHELLPDVISPEGIIDVRAVAGRAQRLANQYNRIVRQHMDRHEAQMGNTVENEKSLTAIVKTIRDGMLNNLGFLQDPGTVSQADYLQMYLDMSTNAPGETGKEDSAVEMVDDEGTKELQSLYDTKPAEGDGGAGEKKPHQLSRGKYGIEAAGGSNEAPVEEGIINTVKNWGKSFWEFAQGEANDGSDWVSFVVDFKGTVDESFSTSTGPHELAGQMNAGSRQARMTRINFAEGNLGDGAIAGAIEKAVSTAKDAVYGLAAGLQLSGLAALAGNAIVDIPNVVQDSTVSMPRLNCTVQLRSPYGNRLSLLRNIWIPAACLLAGAMPISHGVHAHGTPFLCEAYMQGYAAVRLGVIDSLQITRGAGNFGWNYDREALGVDITFSITDLSSIMHMPIHANMSTFGSKAVMALGGLASEVVGSDIPTDIASAAAASTYDEDSSFTDYLAVLGSLALTDMVYPSHKWHLNRIRTIRQWKDQMSPARAAQGFMYGTTLGSFINMLSLPTDRFR